MGGWKLSEITRKKISEARKGQKMSETSKKKISDANKGKLFTEEHKEKLRKAKLGKKLSEDHKKKIGLANKGKIGYWKGKRLSPENIEKKRISSTGRKLTDQEKEKIRQSKIGKKFPKLSGENHWKWIKDRTLLKDDSKDRKGQLHREWSREVKKRDNWKCKINNKDCVGKIEAHHILSWSKFPKLRYEVNNGITLCLTHHPRKRNEEQRLVSFFKNLIQS